MVVTQELFVGLGSSTEAHSMMPAGTILHLRCWALSYVHLALTPTNSETPNRHSERQPLTLHTEIRRFQKVLADVSVQ